jgi:hypothetical protein
VIQVAQIASTALLEILYINCNRMKQILMLCLFILVCLPNMAQIETAENIEVYQPKTTKSQQLFLFGSHGIVIRLIEKKLEKGQRHWIYQLYDTSLKVTKTTTFLFNKGYDLVNSVESAVYQHALFLDKKGNYILATLHVPELTMSRVEGKLLKKTPLLNMKVRGEHAYFEGRTGNSTLIYSINWKTNIQKMTLISLPKGNSNMAVLDGFLVPDSTDEVVAFVSSSPSKQERTKFEGTNVVSKKTEVRRYVLMINKAGSIKSTIRWSGGDDWPDISDFSGNYLGNGKYICFGTYISYPSIKVEGMFIISIEGDQITKSTNHKYEDLDNFLSYYMGKLGKDLHKNIMHNKANKGAKLRYRLKFHNIIPMKKGFLLVGEAYYRNYRLQRGATTTGLTTTFESFTVFDGWQYSHALFAKFDWDGNLIWNKCDEMWFKYQNNMPGKFISVNTLGPDEIDFRFMDDQKIVIKTFDLEREYFRDRKSETFETFRNNDPNLFVTSYLGHWYDGYFVSHGYQLVLSKKNNPRNPNRDLIYIRKIRFD